MAINFSLKRREREREGGRRISFLLRRKSSGTSNKSNGAVLIFSLDLFSLFFEGRVRVLISFFCSMMLMRAKKEMKKGVRFAVDVNEVFVLFSKAV
jgi:hypothetical protein